MAQVLRRSYLKARERFILPTSKQKKLQLPSVWIPLLNRSFSDDKSNLPDFISTTILVENGYNVQELPVVVRKLRNITELDDGTSPERAKNASDNVNYNLIQAEFKQCVDYRDIFSLLSKCTKITPNIAWGAMERIYDLEKEAKSFPVFGAFMYSPRDAILEKLSKVVTKTEDTETILKVLKSFSSLMEPYKPKFCNELLIRTVDNKLSVEQLCLFVEFLIANKSNPKYAETIDKLWVGFVEKEAEVNENNIVLVFKALPGLKASKKIILSILEQKLSDVWYKIKIPDMPEILSSFIQEKYYLSMDSFAVVGKWLFANIHAVDEDTLLDVVTKITRLNYTDVQVEKALEKYMTLKSERIKSYVFVVGILNYCVKLRIRNSRILNSCSEYFVRNADSISPSFLKSFIYPFGLLSFDPENSSQFWKTGENILKEHFLQITPEHLCFIILSYIYIGKYPLDLVSRLFGTEYLIYINNPEIMYRLHLIDTALSVECKDYIGPLLPKDQWCKPMGQQTRIENIIRTIRESLVIVAGGPDHMSTDVMVPHFCDRTYLIDIMIHPAGVDTKLNWRVKSSRNENTAVLIHLPEHYCSDNEQLIGPQVMRKRNLRILGLKVASVKFSIISKLCQSNNTNDLQKYLKDCLNNSEECL